MRSSPLAVLLLFTAANAPSQTPAEPSAVRCDAVLTAEEAVVGDGHQGPAVDEPRPGFTSCDWQGDGSNFGFTFASLKALAADERSADDEFEFDVQALESESTKREVLPGIGVKAAILPAGEDAFAVIVQRTDGVARMITYKVEREKALALARALATP
ncbi:MAG TPA: hypothetical protein PK569_00395 [Thermoanaerobaculia bacterium]|nr:hypothetical protein [Thermoanaerobaculia bacterium]